MSRSMKAMRASMHPPRPANTSCWQSATAASGMDAETQSHIFEPFLQTKGAKGTGLGLSTVYGIIKQSGGFIWVYSEPGKALRSKSIYLRACGRRGNEVLHPRWRPQRLMRGYETILLVEDETNLRRLTSDYLRNQGYTVLEAADGDFGHSDVRIVSRLIHLLLTDVIMPGMNGRDLAIRLAKDRGDMKVLYMSGYTENAIGHNGTLDAGITLLQKPFTLPDLKAKVREMLDTSLPQEVAMAARSLSQAQPAKDQNKNKDRLSAFRAKRFSFNCR